MATIINTETGEKVRIEHSVKLCDCTPTTLMIHKPNPTTRFYCIWKPYIRTMQRCVFGGMVKIYLRHPFAVKEKVGKADGLDYTSLD